MPIPSIELSRLSPTTFEHLVNSVAMSVLGAGHTGFGPGPDGGRDGLFEGTAPYPSQTDRWSGTWYLQSKFRAPTSAGDPQKWLIQQIEAELEEFERAGSDREWPDVWIIATNIDPTAVAKTGSFDKARALVKKANAKLAKRFDIWGGQKILTYLASRPEISSYYAEFLTPGQVLTRLYDSISEDRASVKEIVRYLVATQFVSQQHTKLEQAGSAQDTRPGIDQLFTDLPWLHADARRTTPIAASINFAAARPYRNSDVDNYGDHLNGWMEAPQRSRVWFIKGGPGQGKSTVTQYLAQINRAALILSREISVATPVKRLATRVREAASKLGTFPELPRIPVTIELRQFAQWFGQRQPGQSPEILAYLVEVIGSSLAQMVHAGTLKKAFGGGRWLMILDGLDEVPGDVKDAVAEAITYFVNDVLVECDCDALIVCTSRPQGYSGQFNQLGATVAELAPLLPEEALQCATPVLEVDRSREEADRYIHTLSQALESPAVREIMTTPLQSHIMAVVVRDGGRPPEKRWELFTTFYRVIKRREANRDLPDRRLNAVLREGDKLLKVLHNRLGFELHKRAETSEGAQTSLTRAEFQNVVRSSVISIQEHDIEETVAVLMEATTDRLVLVSTPENGEFVRFDIRPLQEFFAAEYIYEGVDIDQLSERFSIIVGDSHWREVTHFLLSALVSTDRKGELAVAVQSLRLIDEFADPPGRSIRRRLAMGGIITARLAKEGVLEDDRKVRAQFRTCLAPLLAVTDADRYLANVTPAHTRRWLTDFVIETFLGQAEAEALGATKLLLELVEETHPNLDAVRERLESVSTDYFCQFLTQTSDVTWSRLAPPWPAWFAKEFVHRLSHVSWREILLRDRDILDQFAKSDVSTAALRNTGLSELACQAILSAMRDTPSRSRGTSKLKWGILEIYAREGGIDGTWEALSDADWSQILGLGGLFTLMAASIAVILKRPGGNKILNDLTAGHFDDFVELPPVVTDHFDLNSWKKNCDSCGVSNFVRPNLDGSHSYLTTDNPKNPDYLSFVKQMPLVAFNFAAGAHVQSSSRQIRAFLGTPEGLEAFREGMKEQTVGPWSVPFFGSPEPELADVIAEIRARGVNLSHYRPSLGRYYRELMPFKLDLPQEASLLPLLLDLAASELASPSFKRKSEKPRRIASILNLYEARPEQLFEIYQEAALSDHIRLAALGFYLAAMDDSSIWQREAEHMERLFKASGMASFALLVAERLEPGFETMEAGAIAILDRVVEASRNLFHVRTALTHVVAGWREIERAPVSASDPEIWESPEVLEEKLARVSK
ncbi:hypothetical protein [Devosia sp. 1566]|uniref:NACHT domain-containing protein n=1 Tax=Devosia sp. 1566 TaxID=2499144 RepID=UPI000FDC6244|nr:hypothetical protein [Devosia sp. 1566]